MDAFSNRHIGPNDAELRVMTEAIGCTVDELIDRTIPRDIRLENPLKVSKALTEYEYLKHIKRLAAKNKVFKSYLGLGYYGTITPPTIVRNILENPGWYTAYTPYQAEISQGRLEALLNFQTMVMDLSGMELANASLLDEATAAAESMFMLWNARPRADVKAGRNKFFVSDRIFPQSIDVIKGRAEHLEIELEIGDISTFTMSEEYFGVVVQYPDSTGEVKNWKAFTESAHEKGIRVAVAADLLALALIEAPGKWGADVVFGTTQRFGVPMSFGGPHAAFYATREEFSRHIPGRIIGVSKDRRGNVAYRMALQTREQHIKRERATSNICTAQALLAVMASMYACYHGPSGIKRIATQTAQKAGFTAKMMQELGFEIETNNFFDTFTAILPQGVSAETLRDAAEKRESNLRFDQEGRVSLSFSETIYTENIKQLQEVFEEVTGKKSTFNPEDWRTYDIYIAEDISRTGEILVAEVFNRYHSETMLMRYMKSLENKDLSLVHSMIPLGSCTMKLNAAAELTPITWPEFASLHPYAPTEQAEGYHLVIDELCNDLCEITGFAAMSLQPNSGAQGEYAGLKVIRAYHESRGEGHRDIVLIPTSAHGTNPASAVVAGMKVQLVKCDELGNIDVSDLREKAAANADNLGAIMITYPSTHGVYEEQVREVTSIVHEYGGQVYMDGANMNAQVGLTSPGNIGADVCHLNLHKTFAIPHGGGGPGVGPIGVAAHLAPFLPGNAVVPTGGDKHIHGVSAAPYGSALILLISYGYIKMLGAKGLEESTRTAILNANYLRTRLQGHYDVLYTGKNGTVAHEMILDCRGFKRTAGVEVEDIAKRLIDFGFHAPTVSFPVPGTLMVEPTESEDLAELDRFVDAMIQIRDEIRQVEEGQMDKEDNVLKMAPHTAVEVTSNDWEHPYTREEAAYPVDSLRTWKYWVPVARVDNAYGDRNLVCSCLPLEAYA